MAGAKKSTKPTTGRDPAVEAFLQELKHPLKPLIASLREAILAADPTIAEGIKWNAPSFRATEFFATFHLRPQDRVQIILHLGAKARKLPAGGLVVPDPAKLLKWLAPDRATVVFTSAADVANRQNDFAQLIREWIAYL